ncbi:hypothetical protein BT96DRAFT_973913 [Gymnopus androsaceus JB14]|uniref:Uncharacterized protein n=1 Tax=Gymnopus androsaceus JB14 TaxID=1447944 RepID=A0A6A4HZE9_9AGAR|nr:hypothetical protein BT96DRAFT_973913 [Gymnopus androsaceus JB14]
MAQYLSQPRIEGPIWLEPNDISFLQTRFEALEKQISELPTRQKDAKLVEVASLRNILSPIRRIPLEVLSDILELSCIPKDGNFTAGHDIIRYTSMLSRVCVAWRKAAHSNPRMWTKLCLSPYHWKVFLGEVIQIKEWLTRSRGLPLELHLELFRGQKDEHRIHRTTQFLECILDFRRQIRLIDVSGDPESFVSLLRLPRSSLPLLEKLFLSLDWSGDTPDLLELFPHGVEAFLGAPRLQHLRIVDPEVHSMLHGLVVPLEQLTSFEIELAWHEITFDLSVYQQALHQCKSLVSLKVELSDEVEFDANFSEINDLSRDVVGFQNRSAAALASLTLTLHCCLGIDTDCITASFLSILGAFATVETLRIGQAWDFHSGMDDELDPIYDVDALVKAMIYTKGHAILLPKLTNFELSVEDFPSKSTSVLSMIHSRWWTDKSELDFDNVAQLQKVKLRGPFSEVNISKEDLDLPGLIVDFESVATY